MKTLIKYIALSLIAITQLLTSCKTSENFQVYSPVDASIYLPSNLSTPYTTVKSGNSAKIKTPSDGYLGYVVLKDSQNGLEIPVGLNVQNRSTFGTSMVATTGYTLTGVGILSLLTGTLMAVTAKDGDDDLNSQASIFLGAGAGATVIGTTLGATAQSRMKQLSYSYEFKYDKTQRPNIPELSTKLLREDLPKGVNDTSVAHKRKKAASGGKATSVNNSSKAKKTRGDLAKNVIGVYQGSGTLLIDNKVDEEYPNIKVVIKKIDKTHVSVIIIDNGEEFFEAPLNYEISSNGKKGYILSLENVPNAVIEISKTGVLTFIHKNVNIENDIYTLSIKGKKN